MTATRRTPLELKRFGPAEGESVLSTGPCTTRFDRFPHDESSASSCLERDKRFAGSVTAHSAIAALASSRPPVIILRRCVLARPIHLWSVLARPIRLWSVIDVVYALCKHGSFFEFAHAPYRKYTQVHVHVRTLYIQYGLNCDCLHARQNPAYIYPQVILVIGVSF